MPPSQSKTLISSANDVVTVMVMTDDDAGRVKPHAMKCFGSKSDLRAILGLKKKHAMQLVGKITTTTAQDNNGKTVTRWGHHITIPKGLESKVLNKKQETDQNGVRFKVVRVQDNAVEPGAGAVVVSAQPQPAGGNLLPSTS